METVEVSANTEEKEDDGIEIVTLNDMNKKEDDDNDDNDDNDNERVSVDLDRPQTMVTKLQDSTKDVVNTNKDKKGKALSQIPYNLEKLHNKKTLLDVLRTTKLRDLFAVSYIFRYIVCVAVGCIAFVTLAILWKLIFRINTCKIEGDDRAFKYMPFAYGFMIAFKNGLLIVAPLLYVLLPTVHVIHSHRLKFIVAYLFISFLVFTCYGFYAASWTRYSYISISILGALSILLFWNWGGYFAFWVIFPLFSALFVAVIIMSVMREFVFSLIASNPALFSIIYPVYLTVLQTVTFKAMLWMRLPYKIRQFFADCCPTFCCKTEQNGETPVYYDNYDDFWAPSYDLKYIEKRNSTKTSKEMDKSLENTKHSTDKTVIIKKSTNISSKSSSHRYRSTELELTVEDVWSNDILFVAGGVVIVLMESMRVSGMVALKDDKAALILNIISSILLECAGRNNLYLEIMYRCCLKQDNPPLTRFYSSMLGTRFQVEYIPYFVILMMNLTVFGPTDSCKTEYLGETVKMPFNKYWWMYLVLFLSEILSDLFSNLVKKKGRSWGCFGNMDYGDPAREAIYVKLKPWMMVCVFVSFFAISLTAYSLDFDARATTSS